MSAKERTTRLGPFWTVLKLRSSDTFQFEGECKFASKALMDEFQGELGKLFFAHNRWNPGKTT